MTVRIALFSLASMLAVCSFAVAGDAQADRALLDKAAAERTAPPVAATDELAAAEAAARNELTLAQVRLALVQARKALRGEHFAEAAGLAQGAIAALGTLPAAVDTSEFELQAEGVLGRAARAGVDLKSVRAVFLSPIPQDPSSAPSPQADAPPMPAATLEDEARDRGAAAIGRNFDGADTPDVDTTGDAAALRQRAIANQRPDKRGYLPATEIIDARAIEERDQQRVVYEGALRTAVTADEAARLTHAEESRIAGEGWVQYPDNWPAQKARREKYASGQIARSPSWTGADGKEWYAAIYDINDITYQPPDFVLRESLTPTDSYTRSAILHALLHGSEIFNGYPEDLAAGLPLLHALGLGVDDFLMRGPKYSAERQQEVLDLIRAMTSQSPEAKVEIIGP